MTKIAKHLSQGLDIQLSCQIKIIQASEEKSSTWILYDSNNCILGNYDWCICTAAPTGQAQPFKHHNIFCNATKI